MRIPKRIHTTAVDGVPETRDAVLVVLFDVFPEPSKQTALPLAEELVTDTPSKAPISDNQFVLYPEAPDILI